MQSSPSREHAVSEVPSAAANPPSHVVFPGENGGHSLAEMARRDLDAALQLLADRAQYITGATGAAIALRRNGKNDMLCRASTGSNAPELGALLSTEFGLSGESVRTRQALRCDDAERDVRVNREVCRQLGIASVVVMPVVNDDGVLGVFELFSGRVNAFGERDLSAVQRLSEMVETAVRLAEAAEKLPERLKNLGEDAAAPVERVSEEKEPAQPTAVSSQDKEAEQQASSEQVLEEVVLEGAVPQEEEVILEEPAAQPTQVVAEPGTGKSGHQETNIATVASASDGKLTGAKVPLPTAAEFVATVEAVLTPHPAVVAAPSPATETISPAVSREYGPRGEAGGSAAEAVAAPADENIAAATPVVSSPVEPPAPKPESGKKSLLFWSAAVNPSDDATAQETDQSHVPPVLRSLQQCQACGFPVSAGRSLCVECEEKKWRGQLKTPQKQAATASGPGSPESMRPPMAASAKSTEAGDAAAKQELKEGIARQVAASGADPAVPTTLPNSAQGASLASVEGREVSTTNFVLSAGLEPSQSWLAANKYILAVLLVAVLIVAGFFLLR